MQKHIESGAGLAFLSQIIVPDQEVKISKEEKEELSKVSKSLHSRGFNLAVPIACLSDEEDKFFLLTGLPIYNAAQTSGLKQIWIFLIAEKKSKAEKLIEELSLQSKLNDRVIYSEDIKEFLDFINDEKSPLTSIRGIGEKYAKKITDRRPYESPEDMHKKLGDKQPLTWLRAYKERGS